MLLSEPIIHVYEQPEEYSDVVIVGNAKGLKNLYEAIGRILNQKEATLELSQAVINDFNGYNIIIMKINTEKALQQLALPYTDERNMEIDDNKVFPADIINEEEYQKKLKDRK